MTTRTCKFQIGWENERCGAPATHVVFVNDGCSVGSAFDACESHEIDATEVSGWSGCALPRDIPADRDAVRS